jgi:hypothetical protein
MVEVFPVNHCPTSVCGTAAERDWAATQPLKVADKINKSDSFMIIPPEGNRLYS